MQLHMQNALGELIVEKLKIQILMENMIFGGLSKLAGLVMLLKRGLVCHKKGLFEIIHIAPF